MIFQLYFCLTIQACHLYLSKGIRKLIRDKMFCLFSHLLNEFLQHIFFFNNFKLGTEILFFTSFGFTKLLEFVIVFGDFLEGRFDAKNRSDFNSTALA